jgi:peptidyl-prolyl cis-trans isomerase B (cyclophilin B)
VASSRERQRRLERAKVERRIAKQAASLRRRRQIQASIGASLALVLIVVGAVWLLGGFDSDETPGDVAAGTCTWFSEQVGGDVQDTGIPPTTGEARSGTSTVTIKTNQGDIVAELDHEKAPCTTASMAYLAGRQYYDDTTCHRLTTEGIFVVQCGDPKASGSGGPAYRFANEYVPPPTGAPNTAATAPPTVIYPKGTLAMAHSSQPDSNGSQFFIVYKDSPLAADYTVFGKVTQGLDVVEKVAAGGVADGSKDGKPKSELKIVSLSVAPGTGTPTTAATPTGATPATPTGAAPTTATAQPSP